jgi:hypothetical protein
MSATSSRPSSPSPSPASPTSPSAVLAYQNDEIVFIQRIHIPDKDKLLARKIVDSRLIHSIDNLKDVLQMQYLHKLPVEMRYTLYLSIDRLMDYLFLATQRDWPVDRDVENELGVLEQFKIIFANHLQQIIQLLNKKATTKTAAAAAADAAAEASASASAKPTEGEYKSFLHLLNVGVSNFKTMTRLNNVADIARFIQFISYVCNDYNDLKEDLIR